MLKKSISLILCLVMCLSVFTVTATPTLAAYNVKTIFSVKGENIDGDLLTYTISITKEQQNIGGIILNVDFDSTVLEPVNCGPVESTSTEEGTVNNFKGTYAYGVSENNPNMYVIAYMNDIAVSTTSAKGFFKLQFKVIDESRPSTDIKFYCKEYYSTTETDKNITPADGLQTIAEYNGISTLAKPSLKGAKPDIDGIRVSWNGVEGAVGYQIMRSTPTTGWENIAEIGASETEFVDTGLVSGTTYTYTVKAFNNYGVSLYDAIGVSCKYIEKPVISEVNNAVGGVEIKWNATQGADFYLIYRRASGETEWTQIAKRNVNSGTYYKDTTVTDGETYEYDIVSATDMYSTPNEIQGESVTYIAAPTLMSATNELKGIRISWTSHPLATSYIIYRRDKSTQSQLVEHIYTSSTSYLDQDVTAGKVYVYSVKACTNFGDSAYSTTGYTVSRVAHTEVTALTLEKAGVKVHWSPVSGVTGYNIYRRNASESSWTKVGSVSADATSFSDTGLVSGTEYFYAVCPVVSTSEGAKVESDPIYFIASPKNIKAENIIDGIKITWESSKGALRYVLMRVNNNGDYETLTEINANEPLEFIDTDVIWNESYTYTVKAISSRGESLVSDTSSPLIRIGAMGSANPELYEDGIRVSWVPVSEADAYDVYRNDGSGWVQVNEVTESEYIDKNVKSARTYYYAVAAVIGESRGILNTDNAVGFTYIAPPETVTVSNSTDCVKISWSQVDGAKTYYVYRTSVIEGATPRLIKKVSAETLSFTDTDVDCGETFIYTVRTHDGEKLSSDSVSVKNTYLDAPVINTLSRTYTGVAFSWKSIRGAEGYRIYRKAEGDKGWTYVETVGSDILKYTDTKPQNGKRMYYAVRAQSENGISVYIAKSIIYIAAPQLETSNVSKGIQLKWAENPVADSYRIYRKAKSTDSWSYLATSTGTSYLDKTAKAGTTYRYTIKANSDGIYSSYKPAGWAERRLTTPVLKSANNGYGYISVTWNKVPGATGYRVYRKVNKDSSWTYLGNVTTTSYKDTDVKNKATYTYTIRAYYGTSLSTFNSKGVSVKYITAPKLNVANRTGNVTLTWDAVSGASSYYVYRKAGNAKSWTKIATVSKPGYIDKKVNNKTTYTYTIKAYGSKTTSGYYTTGWKTVYLDTPDMLSVKSTRSGITFKWAAVKGCTSYSVFRKEGNGPWVQLGSVNAKTLSYTDKKVEMGVKYTYTVRAKYGNYLSWYEPNMSCAHKY
ncbi:MAG: hypothetical protein E7530_03400 [Ruminococcaceae bacterium]|nr:hypothetical protein [Oscillospiraceae bacterium]